MKKLVLLFAALLVAGCGEKSSSEGSESASESAEPSADSVKPTPAESPSGEPSESPNSLSDADVKRLLKEAVDNASLEERDGLYYHNNEPYSGWAKGWWEDNRGLGQFKDGKKDGLEMRVHENGQKWREATYKDGKIHGLLTLWHKNGYKYAEGTYKDGKRVSAKYWNSKGEEVDSWEESQK